jgi:hypothetical protein
MPDFYPEISDDHWTGTSYDQAMQLGIQSLRRSYTLPAGQGGDWILFGQREALQAAAWFTFARELREADTPTVVVSEPDPKVPMPPFS